ncbi:CU044_2847 family protein [Phormidesmis sp. 146-12]
MSEIQPLHVREENGDTYTIYVAVKDDAVDIPAPVPSDDPDREGYGLDPQAIMVEMVEVHQAIQAYTRYAIGAFKNFSTEHIEEVNLKFGLKIGGRTGIPFLAEATSEGNFEIEVKCKFSNQ